MLCKINISKVHASCESKKILYPIQGWQGRYLPREKPRGFYPGKTGKKVQLFWVNTGKNLWIDRIVINDLLLIDN